jgi:hypothetical protein
MINLSCSAAATAASAVARAAQLLLSNLEHGRRIDAAGKLQLSTPKCVIAMIGCFAKSPGVSMAGLLAI